MSGHKEVMHDDASDAAGALKGEADAFARLYDRHATIVLSLCRRWVPGGVRGGLAEADDAMQESFIRAFRSLAQLDDPANFSRWLYGIARNVCSERTRAAARRNKHEAHAMKANAAAIEAGYVSRNGQVTEAAAAEQLERLSQAMDQLDDDERLAVHLFYLQEESAPQAISAMPGRISRSGFYKLLARAREKLAALMNMDTAALAEPNERVV